MAWYSLIPVFDYSFFGIFILVQTLICCFFCLAYYGESSVQISNSENTFGIYLESRFIPEASKTFFSKVGS